MIVRFWSARLAKTREPDYLRMVRELVLPEFEKLDGYLGAHFLKQEHEDYVEYRVLTYWDSIESVKRMAGDDPKQAFIPEPIAATLNRFETTAEHYESVIEHRPDTF